LAALLAVTIVNWLLLERREVIWQAFWMQQNAAPEQSALRVWDAARWSIGVLGLPAAALVLVWICIADRRVRDWNVPTLLLSWLCFGLLHYNLRSAYEWARETHTVMPRAAVELMTVVSLGAGAYIPFIMFTLTGAWAVSRYAPKDSGAIARDSTGRH
jgi:hypothetical protein